MALRSASVVTLAGLALVATLACNSPTEVRVCTDELRVAWSPGDTTLLIGQSFVPSVTISTCGGRQQLSDVLTWGTSDSSVLRFERTTGRAIGRAAGTASLFVSGERYGSLAEIAVTVR